MQLQPWKGDAQHLEAMHGMLHGMDHTVRSRVQNSTMQPGTLHEPLGNTLKYKSRSGLDVLPTDAKALRTKAYRTSMNFPDSTPSIRGGTWYLNLRTMV